MTKKVTQAMMHHEEAVARKNRCESEAQDAALAVFEAKEIAKEKEDIANAKFEHVEEALKGEVRAENGLQAVMDTMETVKNAELEARSKRLAELHEAKGAKAKPSDKNVASEEEVAGGEEPAKADDESNETKMFGFKSSREKEREQSRRMEEAVQQALDEVFELKMVVEASVREWSEDEEVDRTGDEALEAARQSKRSEEENVTAAEAQVMAELDREFGSLIAQLENAVADATNTVLLARLNREKKEEDAQAAANQAESARDAVEAAEEFAQLAMARAEEAVLQDILALEEMKAANTALAQAQDALLESIGRSSRDESSIDEGGDLETAMVESLEPGMVAEGLGAGSKKKADDDDEEEDEEEEPPVGANAAAIETAAVEVVKLSPQQLKELEQSRKMEEVVAKTLTDVSEMKKAVQAAVGDLADSAEKGGEEVETLSPKDEEEDALGEGSGNGKGTESAAKEASEVVAMVTTQKGVVLNVIPDVMMDDVKDSSAEKPKPKPTVPSSKFYPGAYFGNVEKIQFVTILKQLAPLLVGAGVMVILAACVHQLRSPANVFTKEMVMSTASQIYTGANNLVQPILTAAATVLHLPPSAAGVSTVLWLLGMSVLSVPLVSMIPGGSPVLGFLIGGLVLGPHCSGIIQDVHGVAHLAEFGVIFLLFNIGLELSYERLVSMAKYVFGLGTAQLLLTTAVASVIGVQAGLAVNQAIVVAVGLAFSSTAVAMQVLQDRGETGSRYGRATFSVLLLQDLAVVLVFMLVPLLAPTSDGTIHTMAILKAMAEAIAKTAVAIVAIIAVGRIVLRPLYRCIASTSNAEIFAATTLLVVLGTSLLTESLGLSSALGAFLAGLLLAETEFHLQVESDIAPYRGLLLGLFFMTVGMTVDPKLLVSGFGKVMAMLGALLVGKLAVVTMLGPLVGVSMMNAFRAGLFLAPGGEFAFVTFGEAVREGIINTTLSGELTLVVALSMAVTPWLASAGHALSAKFQKPQDLSALQPESGEVDDLSGHIIVAGFGRVGQMVSQLLSERLFQFVALDVRSERVQAGRALNLPVYFGDAGSAGVLHSVGAGKATCAVICLDTPGANYRAVWALHKNFPSVKTFVRAHDVEHGLNLEKVGATAVVPETLEPSLQLAAAALMQLGLSSEEVAATIDSFRSNHVSELMELATVSKSSLGYGFPGRMQTAALQEQDDTEVLAEVLSEMDADAEVLP